jgi:8-oxo-dGTP diphosphatase
MEKSNIAVSALIIKDGKFLLLKRNNPPFKWGPPAGRVHKGENLIDAVLRETKEEANISVKILMPIAVWSGEHEGEQLISVSFLGEYLSGEIKMSEEHSEAKWVNFPELKNIDITHSIEEFKLAYKIANCLKDNG